MLKYRIQTRSYSLVLNLVDLKIRNQENEATLLMMDIRRIVQATTILSRVTVTTKKYNSTTTSMHTH